MIAAILGLSAVLVAIPTTTSAQDASVRSFLATADRIPRNPTAILHPATRRLQRQVQTAVQTVANEQEALRQSGRPRTTCIPRRPDLTVDQLLGRFRSIPKARRNMTVTQAMREWLADRYPCS
ncbi:hypothetical protein E4M02_08415 [Brevundimonas sp. S30B]|nr:hypothetical protein E4M01_11850 [Brevundimonas sp. MF30-B]TFW02094.1 hypothetical protein E4M02_08415 [Brevundimonas sp. S30B]